MSIMTKEVSWSCPMTWTFSWFLQLSCYMCPIIHYFHWGTFFLLKFLHLCPLLWMTFGNLSLSEENPLCEIFHSFIFPGMKRNTGSLSFLFFLPARRQVCMAIGGIGELLRNSWQDTNTATYQSHEAKTS